MCGVGLAEEGVQTSKNLPEIYFGLRRRQPPAAEQAQVLSNLPDLFYGSSYRTVLYVGANKRRQYFLDWFERVGYTRIVVLEAFEENAEFLKAEIDAKMLAIEVVHGDIRDAGNIPGKFDVAFFWHGPEHLRKDEIEPALKNLEAASKVVVLACPNGVYPQGAEYGNPYEEHLSAIYQQLLEGLGYETDVMGRVGEPSSNILAWKFTGRAVARGGEGS